MQFASLPKAPRSENSPISALDSPFPPLKTEHRYRGVYERAGFDVNLGRSSTSISPDDRSLYSRISPTSSMSKHNQTSVSSPYSNYPQKSERGVYSPASNTPTGSFIPRTRNSKENLSHNRSSSRSVSDSHPGYPSNFGNKERGTAVSSPLASKASLGCMNRNASEPQLPTQAEHRPFIKPFQPEKTNPRLKYSNESREQLKEDRSDRNKKDLKLFIPSNEPPQQQFESIAQRSSETLEDDSPFDRSNASRSSTPATPPSSSNHFERNVDSSPASVKTSELMKRAPYPVLNESVSMERSIESDLAEFRSEIDQHRAYDPRGAASSAQRPSQSKNTGAFVPATGNLADSFNQKVKDSSARTSADDTSFRFMNRNSEEHPSAPSKDFEDFLHTSRDGQNAKQRNSQYSTVSSIISKQRKSTMKWGTRNADEDSADEKDEEIELELQKQLEEIKTGSQLSVASSNNMNSEDSYVTAQTNLVGESSVIPTFNISHANDSKDMSDIRDVSHCQDISHSKDISSGGSEQDSEADSDLDDTNETTFDEEVVPLTVVKKQQQRASDPLTPHFKQTHFETNSLYDTPETIKPLSPKTHCVEEELEGLNFKCSHNHGSKEHHLKALENAPSDDDILQQHPTPSEFDAFPKSVISPNYPLFRNSEAPRKADPGTGPCRACGLEVVVDAKGKDKAIHSKSGDLSGQWHRGCFKCSYTGCSVQFNKETTPYVLLDNAFCNKHYHTLNNTLCETCDTGIEGECIENELKQKWHLSCLKCTKCRGAINHDYYLINHQIVCEADASSVIKELTSSGMMTSDKVERRRTRMLFID